MNELGSLYQQLILEQSKICYGAGTLPGQGANSYQVSPTCGDEVILRVEVADGRLKNLVWDGSGCSISQVSLPMMYQLMARKDLDTVVDLEADFSAMIHSHGQEVDDDLLDRLGDASSLQGVSRYVSRVKRTLLGWMTLKEAIARAEAGLASTALGESAHCYVTDQ